MVFNCFFAQYAGGLPNAAVWLGLNFNERSCSPGNSDERYLAICTPICGNTIARLDYNGVISSARLVAAGKNDLTSIFGQ